MISKYLTNVFLIPRVLNQRTKYIEQLLDLKGPKIVTGSEFDFYVSQHEDCIPGTRVELLCEIEE